MTPDPGIVPPESAGPYNRGAASAAFPLVAEPNFALEALTDDDDTPIGDLITVEEASAISKDPVLLAAALWPHIAHPRKRAFLGAYARTAGATNRAAIAAGIKSQTVNNWRNNDPIFAQAMVEAMEVACEIAEAEADRRALEGVEEPVFYLGEQVGTKRRYSDNLLMFRLKALAPAKYREAREVNVRGGMTHLHQAIPAADLRQSAQERLDALSLARTPEPESQPVLAPSLVAGVIEATAVELAEADAESPDSD